MLKIKPVMLFSMNVIILLSSWIAYVNPQGDEYLFLFLLPVVFVLVPQVLSFRLAVLITILNFFFLFFYTTLGVLNLIDLVVLMLLFVLIAGKSYVAEYLYGMFSKLYKREVIVTQRKYNSLVSELEAIDERAKRIETELVRISRLYEITKKLAPALKFEDLADILFDFLEDNFTLTRAHLMICSGNECLRCISKYPGRSDEPSNSETPLNCEKVMNYCSEREMISFYITGEENRELFEEMGIPAKTFMVFPIAVGGQFSAILAVEGPPRTMYGRFRLLMPQISLEFRKVQLYEKVQELSIMDGLTEVYLRRYLMERLEEEVDRAKRLDLVFSVGMVDVDHFKDCNDRHGHLVGDAVLNKIAERLKNSVREVDMIARYGGEEFCIVLPETSRDLAISVGERVRRSVEKKPIKAFDEELNITVSVGLATYPEDGTRIETLLEKADTALYKAKRRGRNMVCTI